MLNPSMPTTLGNDVIVLFNYFLLYPLSSLYMITEAKRFISGTALQLCDSTKRDITLRLSLACATPLEWASV